MRKLVKTTVVALAVGILAVSFATTLRAEGNGSGPDSPVVVGEVLSVKDGSVLVRQKNGGYERELRLDKDSKIRYLGFKGTGQTDVSAPRKGFLVKAKVAPGDLVKSIYFTPPLPASHLIPNPHLKTVAELFKAADQNGNGKVDYVEFSVAIMYSPKHGPQHFSAHDKDADDGLDVKEFEGVLNALTSWRLSRKTPEQWMAEADKDKDGELDAQEFRSITGSHHGGGLEQTDQDGSGKLSVAELGKYLQAKIASRTIDEDESE